MADFRKIAGDCKRALLAMTPSERVVTAALGAASVAVLILAVDDLRWQGRFIDLHARLDTLMKVSNDADFWRNEARNALAALSKECKR